MSSAAAIVESPQRAPASMKTLLALAALLALIGMNVSTVLLDSDIDSSFRVLLTEAALGKVQFGVDLIWPYGPLGFIAGPTLIDRGMLVLALLYQFATLVVLFATVLAQLASMGIPRWQAVIGLAPVALAISITDNLFPEIAGVTIVVALLRLWNRGCFEQWRAAVNALLIAGVLAGSLVLIKFGPGGLACAVVMLIAMMSRHRMRAVPLAGMALLAGFLVAWFATGQQAAGLFPYFRTELEVVGGYQQAQAFNPYGRKVIGIGLFALLLVAIGAVAAVRWQRVQRNAWQVLLPLALATWFVVKQSFIRWDAWHVIGGLLLISLLLTMLRWDQRLQKLLPLGLLVSGMGAMAAEPGRLVTTWSQRLQTAMVVASGAHHSSTLAAVREQLRGKYAIPDSILRALAGGSVHAEPWDINAVWANGLQMSVLPTPQSYATYTAELDRINAARYASAAGPDGVLFNPGASVDTRYSLWESPAARLALTCHFVPVAAEGSWLALRRQHDVCGEPRPLGTYQLEPGKAIAVPAASRTDAIVVAHYELPADPAAHLVATITRPWKFPFATVDGTRYRLVPGTASNAHILRSPGRVGTRDLPHGAVSHSSLSFGNTGAGNVTVRFEEIPLTP